MLGLCVGILLLCSPAAAGPVAVQASHNPILSDGRIYSADPAPIVVGDTLYILAGRDEAPPQTNDFIMNRWLLLSTRDTASGDWLLYPDFLRPEQVFSWAAPGRAYAGQIVQGPGGRFYLYAPVMQADCPSRDCMAIGVAVADDVLGPWHDAHPAGPIVSQSVPEQNDIQNIDPAPFVDDDGRVYLYWGTFGELRALELEPDMVTPKSKEISIPGLKGFFEAAWLFKRRGTYYLAFADNDPDPKGGCTPAIYHACIAYATSSSPLGPWTMRGVILPPVSSTTSHPGIVRFKGEWYLVYHTADAKGGGHFRRSVAIDRITWDETVQPPAIRKVVTTPRPVPVVRWQRNVAPLAHASSSNEPIPVRFWLKSLNDGILPENPLPPDVWGTGRNGPAESWIAYHWDAPVTLNASRMLFWSDDDPNSAIAAKAPKSWHLEYCKDNEWRRVKAATGYSVAADRFVTMRFKPVTTRCLRASFVSSSTGQSHAGIAVREWEALAAKPVKVVLEER